jgi:L-2-hydroxyglutarate oxidase LhgO
MPLVSVTCRCLSMKISYTGKAPFRHLIYPMPEEAGLGTHLTLTLDGGAKFGPDSEWVEWDPDEGPDYSVDPARAEKFYSGARQQHEASSFHAQHPDAAEAVCLTASSSLYVASTTCSHAEACTCSNP